MPTLQQKYDFLCSKFRLSSVDFWEQDALLVCPDDSYYFQFSEPPTTIDEAVSALVVRESLKHRYQEDQILPVISR
jgi:hypothetical protein